MDCPLSALMSQVGRSTPGAKVVVSQLMGRWEALIRAGIEELQASGEADADLDAAQVAAALIAGIQGGVGMLMTTGSTRNLEAAIDLVLDRLSGGARSV